jgi:hypothetical protein
MITINATTYFIQVPEFSTMTTLTNSSDTVEINMDDKIIRGVISAPVSIAFDRAEGQGYFKCSHKDSDRNNYTFTPTRSTDSLKDGKLYIDVNDVPHDGSRMVCFIIHSVK